MPRFQIFDGFTSQPATVVTGSVHNLLTQIVTAIDSTTATVEFGQLVYSVTGRNLVAEADGSGLLRFVSGTIHGFSVTVAGIGVPVVSASGLRLDVAGLLPAAAALSAGDGRALVAALLPLGWSFFGNSGPDVLPVGNDVTPLGVTDFSGNDRFVLGLGDDTLWSGAGNDTIQGGGGHDSLAGGAGDDTLQGQGGHDRLSGGAGNDEAFGGAGDDFVFGNAGDDRLHGGAGRDRLHGGAGNDRLDGGGGDDILRLGTGRDTVFWSEGDGNDVVVGFQGGAMGDLLILENVSSIGVTQTARGTLVDIDLQATILLVGVNMADFTSDNYVFV